MPITANTIATKKTIPPITNALLPESGAWLSFETCVVEGVFVVIVDKGEEVIVKLSVVTEVVLDGTKVGDTELETLGLVELTVEGMGLDVLVTGDSVGLWAIANAANITTAFMFGLKSGKCAHFQCGLNCFNRPL